MNLVKDIPGLTELPALKVDGLFGSTTEAAVKEAIAYRNVSWICLSAVHLITECYCTGKRDAVRGLCKRA